MPQLRRLAIPLTALLLLAFAPQATAHEGHHPRPRFSKTLDLPDGFQPEGIAIGPGPTAFLGSLADGSIYRARPAHRPRQGHQPRARHAVRRAEGRRARRLYVAGGPAGTARVIDARSGRVLATYRLATRREVRQRRRADPGRRLVHRLHQPGALQRPAHGHAAAAARRSRSPATWCTGAGFNANGIARTPDGKGPAGRAVQHRRAVPRRTAQRARTRRSTSATALPNGDGLLLRGRTLYVVRTGTTSSPPAPGPDRRPRAASRGVTDPRFDVPTTVAPSASGCTSPTPASERRRNRPRNIR